MPSTSSRTPSSSTCSARSVRTGSTRRIPTSVGRDSHADSDPTMKQTLALFVVVLATLVLGATAEQAPSSSGAVFVAYYWRAKPGQTDAYNDYIRKTAEPID